MLKGMASESVNDVKLFIVFLRNIEQISNSAIVHAIPLSATSTFDKARIQVPFQARRTQIRFLLSGFPRLSTPTSIC